MKYDHFSSGVDGVIHTASPLAGRAADLNGAISVGILPNF
jgi:hypothetical protein